VIKASNHSGQKREGITMFRTNGVGWLGLFIALGTGSVALAVAGEGPFRDLSLNRARQAAADGGKRFVLVDFYTVWCGPCKKLDETTWKDQEVRDWLSKEAVCLKLDAEKDVPLAEKYRINVYPTVLLLRPDGAEIDRLVGYRDAKTFLADAREALAGNDSLTRARKKLEGPNANDPSLRMSYGDALAQKGRAEDALSEYLWCFDHGLEHGPGFTGVRLSFLLSRIVQLGQTHPAAIDELRKRRDAAAKDIEARRADFNSAMGLAALNSNLDEAQQTLALFDRIKADKSQPAMVRQYLFDQAIDQLLAAKRYKDIAAESDGKSKVRQRIARHEQEKGFYPNEPRLRYFMKAQVSGDGAKYYEALLGSGDRIGAAEVAAMLVAFDRSDAYPQLIAAAKRAGDVHAAEALAEEARKTANPESKPPAATANPDDRPES
jgi:thiol-disulfide isomerase/thioredoxin